MPRIVAFMALHYGLEYIQQAIQSVQHAVDCFVVCYSPIGSHGHKTAIACPETEKELIAAAQEVMAVPVKWHRGFWPHEGAQRDTVFKLEPDADLVIVVDSDEIWAPGAVEKAIEQGLQMTVRHGHVPFWHFWRSFQYFCTDLAQPERVINPHYQDGHAFLEVPPVFHMGYAQREEIIKYKMLVHGHKPEWREDWLRLFQAWTPQDGPWEDLHPTNIDFWTARAFAMEQLPPLLKAHPYYGVKVIR